jgi:flagellar basal-body rod modification protein FlgD
MLHECASVPVASWEFIKTFKEAKMSTSAVTSTTSTSNTLVSLETEDLLKLILTRLENHPVDSSEMTSQVCRLTQVSQSDRINEYLETFVQYSTSIYNSHPASYIGKTISYSHNELAISSGVTGSACLTLANSAEHVSVAIYDADGNWVNTVELGSLSAGAHSFTWDSTDDGRYTFEVSATDATGNNVSVSTGGTAKVTGIVYENGFPYLVTDSGKISPEDVTTVT